MKLPFLKSKKTRGKGKSPEAKARDAQARTEQLLANQWYKLLKDDPELCQQIARQKYGLVEPAISVNGEYMERSPDLLETLRTAREARDLIKDEMGPTDSRSWIRDLAEIIKVLPQALQAVQAQGLIGGQSQHRPQPMPQQPPLGRLSQPEQEQPEQQIQLKFETLLPLLDLSPQEVVEYLRAGDDNEQLWLGLLATVDYPTIRQILDRVEDPQLQPYIAQLSSEDRKHWVEDVLRQAKIAYDGAKGR